MTWTQRGSTIGLLAMSVALCLIIAAEISGARQGGQSRPVQTQVAAASRPGPVTRTDATDPHEAWLNEITTRPLFSPTRRPAETTISGLPRLTGIVVAGSQRVAIFAAPANQHPIVAQAGTRVGAYEVQTIGDEGVTVVGPGGTTLIKPIFDASRPSAPVPPGRPQPRHAVR